MLTVDLFTLCTSFSMYIHIYIKGLYTYCYPRKWMCNFYQQHSIVRQFNVIWLHVSNSYSPLRPTFQPTYTVAYLHLSPDDSILLYCLALLCCAELELCCFSIACDTCVCVCVCVVFTVFSDYFFRWSGWHYFHKRLVICTEAGV